MRPSLVIFRSASALSAMAPSPLVDAVPPLFRASPPDTPPLRGLRPAPKPGVVSCEASMGLESILEHRPN